MVERLVVGVDGSAASVEALRWALDEARRREAALQIVTAWTYPALAIFPIAPTVPLPEELDASARAMLERTVQQAGGAHGVAVELKVVQGHPAEVLLCAARDADLLVVASRGLGGFRRLLLGSVSSACAAHAPCPVVIVPTTPR